jgi:hypothetical protein
VSVVVCVVSSCTGFVGAPLGHDAEVEIGLRAGDLRV